MNFLKDIIKHRKLIFQLGKNDFKNKFASTGLGAIWGFIQPFIFIITYVIIFQYILKTGNTGATPYVVWFLPGLAIWMFLNDSILYASGSIRQYSYLVKKVVFPIDIIPLISVLSSCFVGAFLIFIAIIVCLIFGYIANFLMILYFLIAALLFIVAMTRFTSSLTTLVPDFGNLLGIVMQLMFWFTPIIWNINMLLDKVIIYKILCCNPFTYLVNGFRDCFVSTNFWNVEFLISSLIFWLITIILFIWGNTVFRRSKKDFADVL